MATTTKCCPICGSRLAHCVECYRLYPLGLMAKCQRPECAAMNAPVACECEYDVAEDLTGVVDFNGVFYPFVEGT